MTARTVSLACANVATGDLLVAERAEESHYAASTIKLAVLVAAARAGDGGRLDPTAGIKVTDRWSGADGAPFTLVADDADPDLAARTGQLVPLEDLLEAMITTSSNVAANVVVDAVGMAAVERAVVAVDAGGCRLRHHFGDRRARAAGPVNTVTAAGLAALMAGIGRASAASPPRCQEMEQRCARQQHRELIPAALPFGTFVASKSGWAPGVLHDVALVRPAGADPYALAVCTSGFDDPAEATVELHRVAAACHRAATAGVRP